MRLRNVKNKDEIIKNSPFLVLNPESNIGNWQNVFNNTNSIELEIGVGKGKFLIEKAIKNPNINYIGIEKQDSVIVRALEKTPNEIPNLKFIRMNADNIDMVFKQEIDKVYLNFSDPWPKKRHVNRRLTSPLFLGKYSSIFRDNKTIYQRTDNKELFEYSIISLTNNGYSIKEVSLNLHKSDFFDNITTEYEDRFTSKGNEIYYLKAENDN